MPHRHVQLEGLASSTMLTSPSPTFQGRASHRLHLPQHASERLHHRLKQLIRYFINVYNLEEPPPKRHHRRLHRLGTRPSPLISTAKRGGGAYIGQPIQLEGQTLPDAHDPKEASLVDYVLHLDKPRQMCLR